jgi:hypothetical protein
VEPQTNTMASVALGAGVGSIVVHVLLMCIGIIPLFGLMFLPVAVFLIWALDLVAIVTGIIGVRAAGRLGIGRGAAMAGIGMGVCSILLQIVGLGLVVFGGVGLGILGLLAG